jgi:hypothetical protein
MLMALGVLVAGLAPERASAHQVGLSRGEYRLEGTLLRAELVFARQELIGLVHGFGFAGALGELAVPWEQLIPALVSFNLGVEAGQLAVLSLSHAAPEGFGVAQAP